MHAQGFMIAAFNTTINFFFFWLGMVAYVRNPITLGSRGGWITRSRDQDHPGQQAETLSLLKIQKLAGRGGGRL